jgi:hypothetical protein
MRWTSHLAVLSILLASAATSGQGARAVSSADATDQQKRIIERINAATKSSPVPNATNSEFKLPATVDASNVAAPQPKRSMELQIGKIADKPLFATFEIGKDDKESEKTLMALPDKIKWSDPRIQSCTGGSVCVERDPNGACTKSVCKD